MTCKHASRQMRFAILMAATHTLTSTSMAAQQWKVHLLFSWRFAVEGLATCTTAGACCGTVAVRRHMLPH